MREGTGKGRWKGKRGREREGKEDKFLEGIMRGGEGSEGGKRERRGFLPNENPVDGSAEL